MTCLLTKMVNSVYDNKTFTKKRIAFCGVIGKKFVYNLVSFHIYITILITFYNLFTINTYQ